MGRQHDRAASRDRFAQDIRDQRDTVGIEGREWLIHQEDIRPRQHRAL